jgi:tetratricopeptide (TPR) repeat protein
MRSAARALSRLRFLLRTASAMWFAFLFANVAFAQSDAASRDRARDHFHQGLVLVEQQQFEPALAAFWAAYRASPEPAGLYNIGQTYIALGKPLEAIAALEQYLIGGAAEIPAARLDQVTRQLGTLRAKTAEIAITSGTPGVTLALDGKELGRAPIAAPVRVMPGAHVVSATSADGSKLSRPVTLDAGDRLDLRIDPPAPATAPRVLPRAGEPIKPLARREPSRPSPSALSTWGYVAGGLGIGLAATAVGHYLWNLGRYDRWRTTRSALNGQEAMADYSERQAKNNELAASIDSASRVTVSLSLGAGALVGTGVTLVILDSGRSPSGSSKAASFALSYGGLW